MKTSSDRAVLAMKMNRRDALKLIAAGGAGLVAGAPRTGGAGTRLSLPASRKHAKIVVAGSGMAAMDVAARIRRAAPRAEITLIEPNAIHLYEPGQVFVAAGLYEAADIERRTRELLPDKVKWLRDEITEFDPENNAVLTRDNGRIGYDFLVVAMDAEYDYAAIDGLTRETIGKHGIASVWLNDTAKGTERGGESTRRWYRQLYRSAAERDLQVLCIEPETPVKYIGTGLDILFLGNDMLRGHGPDAHPDTSGPHGRFSAKRHEKSKRRKRNVSQRAHFTLVTPKKRLFPTDGHDKALRQLIAEAGNIDIVAGQTLVEIDPAARRAGFRAGVDRHERKFDFIHITPPMRAPKALRDSPLAVAKGEMKGWMEVDEKSLLHPRFGNIIGIGHAIATRFGRTVGSTREQAIVIQDNIVSLLEGRKLPASYSGYTEARIKTRYGAEILAEFDDNGVISELAMNPYKPHWLWWAWDLHAMPWIYFNLMMRGMY